jgi:hypothetical protein
MHVRFRGPIRLVMRVLGDDLYGLSGTRATPALVTRVAGTLYLFDVASTNGVLTLPDEIEVELVELADGTAVGLGGEVEVRWLHGEPAHRPSLRP